MAIPLASDRPQILQAGTIGAAWLAVARRILADGVATRYDDLAVREISLVTLAVAWVIDRLRQDPVSRSATITTFQPHTDTSYIPCVSLLDFWRPGGAVELVTYAHSIDFGAKGYGNLVELAALQQHVARELGLPAGRLLMIVKSAHVYETERAYVLGVLAAEDSLTADGEAG